MTKRGWKPTEVIALLTVLLGFVLEFAPLLLFQISPSLGSLTGSQGFIPGFTVNASYGIAFIVLGVLIYVAAKRRR